MKLKSNSNNVEKRMQDSLCDNDLDLSQSRRVERHAALGAMAKLLQNGHLVFLIR